MLQLSILHAALLRLPSHQSRASFDNPARPGVGAATWLALRRRSLPALGFSDQHLLVPGERLKFLTTSPAQAASISRSVVDNHSCLIQVPKRGALVGAVTPLLEVVRVEESSAGRLVVLTRCVGRVLVEAVPDECTVVARIFTDAGISTWVGTDAPSIVQKIERVRSSGRALQSRIDLLAERGGGCRGAHHRWLHQPTGAGRCRPVADQFSRACRTLGLLPLAFHPGLLAVLTAWMSAERRSSADAALIAPYRDAWGVADAEAATAHLLSFASLEGLSAASRREAMRARDTGGRLELSLRAHEAMEKRLAAELSVRRAFPPPGRGQHSDCG